MAIGNFFESNQIKLFVFQDEDKKAGGITLPRYQELYAQFIGNPDESNPAVNLFGPLTEIA